MFFYVLGILSALIFLIGDVPYVLDTLHGKTKPHRVTWGIATLLNAIGFANQFASGATNSLWIFGAGTLMVGFIFCISLRKGTGGRDNADIACLAISILGIVLWAILKSPTYSILANLLADATALLPTYKKAAKDPNSETKISWLIGTISVFLATISVGKLDWRLLLLPAASTLMQAYVVYLLYRPRSKSHPG